MSFPSGPAPGSHGYWNDGQVPTNVHPYGIQRNPSQPTPMQLHVQNGQYQQPSIPHMQQHQIAQPSYPQRSVPIPATQNLPPQSIRPQNIQVHPQFIDPSQLFQRPEIQPQYQSGAPSPFGRPAAPLQTTQLTNMAPIKSQTKELDRPMLLMSLAEEYFDAAHALAPSTSIALMGDDVETYEKLISTGLGCLDTALKHIRLSPRVEANIRLRYAGVLYEETENFMEAETALSKGIALCERNHYFDIKYAMQFLLAQLMFEKNPKASLKALDGHIADAQAYQHYSWVYALRFLRVSYCLQSGTTSDTNAALAHLKAIADLSHDQSDRAIYITASLVEAMAHLRCTGVEAMENAQQAIAQVWTYQLDSDAKIPQLLGLAHMLDVACSMRQGNTQVITKKLNDLQAMMDSIIKDTTWSPTSDLIAIPISRRHNSSQVVSPDTRMVLGIGIDGRDNLMVSFLNKNDAFAITYLLSGMILLRKTSGDFSKNQDHKAMKFLKTGLHSLKVDIKSCRASSGLLSDLLSQRQWRGHISCYVNGCMAFYAAAAGSWADVKTNIDNFNATAKDLDLTLTKPLTLLSLYLAGVFYQGIGKLDVALEIFQDEVFDLPPHSDPAICARSVDQVERDLSILAALNSLWILQEGERKDLTANTSLIARLGPFCANHLNNEVQTAYNLILATVETNPPTPIYKVKSCLKMALEGAQAAVNTQFLCITLNVMCSKFFSNVVGTQAEKSANAADHHAKRSGNVLWKSVAAQMLARAFEVNGRKSDAQAASSQAHLFTSELHATQRVSDLYEDSHSH